MLPEIACLSCPVNLERYPSDIMIDNAKIRSTLPHWLETNSSASDNAIDELTAAVGFELSSVYLRLLGEADGGETFLGDDDSDNGSYLVLWPSSDVVAMNNEHKISTHAPDFFAFGTNGGGELFAFDTKRKDDAVFMLPEIGLTGNAAMLYCKSFSALIALLPGFDG